MTLFKIQLFLFIVLLLLWNILIPAFEGADEVGHYCHADYIANRNKLPNLNKIDGCFLWHPPLYYVLQIPVIKLFKSAEFKIGDLTQNPNFSNLKHGQYSQFVHTKEEWQFKWDNKTLKVHILRLVSSVFAVLIFLLTWKLSKTVFKKKEQRNLSLLVFFNPMFLHIFTTLTNVTLISLIATLIIAIDIVNLNERKSEKTLLLEGILLGLGFLTKITVVSLLFAKTFVLLKSIQASPKTLREKTKELLVMLAGFLLAAGWYILRSINLYGSIIERDTIAKIPGEYVHEQFVQEIGIINYISSLFTTLARTFWSGFGAITVNFPDWINLILLTITLLVAYAVAKNFKHTNSALRLCTIYLVSISFGLLLMNLKLRAMHAKDLFPAYLPIAFLFSFGISKLREIKTQSAAFSVAIFLVLAYFSAQNEIVRGLKYISGQNSLIDVESILMLIVILLFKLIFVYLIIKTVGTVLRNMPLSEKAIRFYTYGLFLINLAVVSVSSYLFYFRFL